MSWLSTLFSDPGKALQEAVSLPVDLITDPAKVLKENKSSVAPLAAILGTVGGSFIGQPEIGAALGGALGSAVSGGKPVQDLESGGAAFLTSELGNYLLNNLAPGSTAANIAGGTETATGGTPTSLSSLLGIGGTNVDPVPAVTTSDLGLSDLQAAVLADPGAPGFSSVGGTPTSEQLSSMLNNLPTGSAGAAGTSSGVGTSLSSLLSNPGSIPGAALSYVEKNPGVALGAAGLGLTALNNSRQPAGYSNLVSSANQLSGQASQLQGYLSSGTLPPGVSQGITQAEDATIASIKSKYAQMGMSGSSAEAQDIANAQAAV